VDSFFSYSLAFLVTLGILITVHEFGHFWVARRLGVKVLRFSIGFGAPLWSRRSAIDDTEYVVAAIPLGGYVKMLDEREEPVAEAELHRAFNRQPLWARSAIVVAGPAANLIFAVAALWLGLVIGEAGLKPLVGEIVSGSAAEQAGLVAGDQIIEVAGTPTPTWGAVLGALVVAAGDESSVAIKIRHEDKSEQTAALPSDLILKRAEEPEFLRGIGLVPKVPEIPAVIGEVVSGEAAAKGGLQPGDRILSLNGQATATWTEFTRLIKELPNEAIELEIDRDGVHRLLTLRLGETTDNGKRIGRIGAAVRIPEGLYDDYRAVMRLGWFDAIGAAGTTTWNTSVLILRVFGRLIVGQASLNNLGGPISIAQSAGRSAEVGGVAFLKFLANISIVLAVMNLLPIPLLDGGHLLFFLVEGVKGSALSEEAQLLGQKIGVAFLLTLMGLAFYMDISRLLG